VVAAHGPAPCPTRAVPPPPRLKEDAEFLRLALVTGYAIPREAIAWADRVIEATTPDLAVIEVALAPARVSDTAASLRAVPGAADPVRVRRRLLGRMLEAVDADPRRAEEVASALCRLAGEGELPRAEFGTDPYLLDDSFELARGGIFGDREAVVEELRSYLREHALPAWPGE
jgi:hypothetical protein